MSSTEDPAVPDRHRSLKLVILLFTLVNAVLILALYAKGWNSPPSAATSLTARPSPPAQPPPAPLHPSPPPTDPPPEVVHACREKYFESLRKLLPYFSTQRSEPLKEALEGFRGVVSGYDHRYVLNRYIRSSQIYLAWCQEQLGDKTLRDQFIKDGFFSEVHYLYFFSHQDQAGFINFQMDQACQGIREDLKKALLAYGKRHGGKYPASLRDLVPSDCDRLPPCPFSGEASYSINSTTATTRDTAAEPIICGHAQPLAALGAAGQPPSGMPADDPSEMNRQLEQKYKAHVMLLDGYTESPRQAKHWLDMARISGLAPGETVADIGCGPGLFTLNMARAVGPRGKVIAVDINRSVLDFVEFAAARQPDLHVETFLTSKNALGLPPRSLDAAFVIECYHANVDLQDPREERNLQTHLLPWLRTVLEALKPGGRLLIGDGNVTQAVVREQVPQAGFESVPIPPENVTPRNREYFSLFRRPR